MLSGYRVGRVTQRPWVSHLRLPRYIEIWRFDSFVVTSPLELYDTELSFVYESVRWYDVIVTRR